MEEKTLRLYVDAEYTSPYAMSVFVALREKNLDFEMLTIDLSAMQNRSKAFAAKSLTQRVPTLESGDFSLSESSAITEYLDERYPGTRLYPQDVQQRAKARQVQAWLRSDLMPIRSERNTLGVFYGEKFPPLSEAGNKAAESLYFFADAMLASSTVNLFGDWCIADVDLAMMINRLALHGDHVPERLREYAAHQWARPAVQEWASLVRPALA